MTSTLVVQHMNIEYRKLFTGNTTLRDMETNKGIKNMLPQHIPTIKGKDAEDFVAQDKKRLTSAEKTNLEKCRAIYKKNPIK